MNHHFSPASAASLPQRRRRLKPLALALIAAFPVYGGAQTAIVRPPAPAPAAVPKPLPGWRVSGTGAPAPTNQANAAGGTDQTIVQTSQRGIYNWQSFDIGAASSVTFSFPGSDSSALNRVLGSSAPSQIFGSLRSIYANPVAGKAPLVGGSIYLINANGILFGRNAQVNVGSLVASTLNLGDADFNSGLTTAITGSNPAFSYQGAPELFTDAHNFVVVDPGATITTPNGGRVFLFAKNVQNAGTITTPGGQTVLAAGSEVFLNDPTAELLYASEVNPAFPALRGLLVEVGQGSGTATNLAGGVIDTPRGNATLVGMAVNQSGRISATTSVNENGSVMLLARGNTQVTSGNGVTVKRATTSGTLTLGSGSRIEIAPDTTPAADGKTGSG
jgi:filamentous hemagglutinin family protein